MNDGGRKYKISLFIIATTNVLCFAGCISGGQSVALLTGVGLGYGLFNKWGKNGNAK